MPSARARSAAAPSRWITGMPSEIPEHLDVDEAHALRPTGAEDLHHGFLRGEPPGEELIGNGTRGEDREFRRGEDPLREVRAEPFAGSPDPVDLHCVDADATGHGGRKPRRPFVGKEIP